MTRRCFARALLIGLSCLALLPMTAAAQSAIAGVVTDTSGAVLPGVTVEASSPALIEKVRTAVSDARGLYTIVDLRPGTYKVTFSLTGFVSLVREGTDVPSNVTVAVNAELPVGAVEETVTVSGAAPIVDVRNASRTEVLSRTMLDQLPTSRMLQTVGAIIPGLKLGKPDMGGTTGSQQTYVSAYGAPEVHNAMQVDGINIRTNNDIGGTQQYQNFGMVGEVVYQMSGIGAESPSGGVLINMIPKDGGNRYGAQFYNSWTPARWQSRNITSELITRGLPSASAISITDDINPAFGGPLMRDRLWFYGSYRYQQNNLKPAGSFYQDGRVGVEDQYVAWGSLHLTAQVTPKNRLSLYLDRAWKNKIHDMTDTVPAGGTSGGVEIETASTRRPPVSYYTGVAKWTSTLSSRLLFETGFAPNNYNRKAIPQEGVYKTPFTPEWYAGAQRIDLVTGTSKTSTGYSHAIEAAVVIASSMSYVTGSHNLKVGFQHRYGPERDSTWRNADLQQLYRMGVPDSVIVFNSPTFSSEYLNADDGFYAQDSWALGHLTINPGVRLDWFNTSIEASSVRPGRFAPQRSTERVPDLPSWFDVSPRFGVVYDVFGDAKTAIKVNVSKYMRPQATIIAHRYNVIVNDTDARNWFDVDLIPGTSTLSGIARPTDHDDIAQDNEIGPGRANFGKAADRRMDPNLKREYNMFYHLSVQHELLPRTSVTAAFNRRQYFRVPGLFNEAVSPSDYIPFQVQNPLPGSTEIITIYNLDQAKRGVQRLVDRSSKINTSIYNGVELSFNMRLTNAGFVTGGWSIERTRDVTCDQVSPNGTGATGGRFCDERKLDIPLRHEFKLATGHSLPGGLQVSGSMLSYAGQPLNVLWAVPATVFPNGQRTESVAVNLIPPKSKFLKRWNQLDLGAKKRFRLTNQLEFLAQLDVFNVLNSSVVLGEIQNFGARLGTPSITMQGRLYKISSELRF